MTMPPQRCLRGLEGHEVADAGLVVATAVVDDEDVAGP
jgi:hypothetical protein